MRLWSVAASVGACWLAALLAWPADAAKPVKSVGVPMATDDRVQMPGWWPTKGTSARTAYLGSQACADCHATKFRSQIKTPMALAAMPASDSEPLRAHDELSLPLAAYEYKITRLQDGSRYSVSDGKQTLSMPIPWAFGLGHSGQTYVLEHSGKFYESRVSYFPGIGGLDLTPGQTAESSVSLEDALGRPMLYRGETQRCFGCHTTASTVSGRFDPDHSFLGVTCEACHGPGAKHVANMKAKNMKAGLNAILDPGQLNPVDQVDFCGACHRSYVDVILSKTTGIRNLRFQPYRLERSQCWIKSQAITCISCHDPHQPLVQDVASYDDRCLACHQPGHAKKVCKVSSNDCASCHMPKYEMPGMHAKFTDHFIRVAKDGEGYFE